MKQINVNKYMVGKKKLGKGQRGSKGGMGVQQGHLAENPSSIKKGLTNLSSLS